MSKRGKFHCGMKIGASDVIIRKKISQRGLLHTLFIRIDAVWATFCTSPKLMESLHHSAFNLGMRKVRASIRQTSSDLLHQPCFVRRLDLFVFCLR